MTDEVSKEVGDLLNELVKLAEDINPKTIEATKARQKEIAGRLRTLLNLPQH